MQNVFGIGSARLYLPSKPVRDPAYRRFIRSLPCAACGKSRFIECAHTGPHGLSQKASDLDCIPLCANPCHPCQSCGKPCDSLTRCSWDSDLMVGPCCQISSEDLAEIRPCCETLYHLVCQAQTVQAVCEAFDSHEKSGCPICQGARKTIAGQVETKQERRAA